MYSCTLKVHLRATPDDFSSLSQKSPIFIPYLIFLVSPSCHAFGHSWINHAFDQITIRKQHFVVHKSTLQNHVCVIHQRMFAIQPSFKPLQKIISKIWKPGILISFLCITLSRSLSFSLSSAHTFLTRNKPKYGFLPSRPSKIYLTVPCLPWS